MAMSVLWPVSILSQTNDSSSQITVFQFSQAISVAYYSFLRVEPIDFSSIQGLNVVPDHIALHKSKGRAKRKNIHNQLFLIINYQYMEKKHTHCEGF